MECGARTICDNVISLGMECWVRLDKSSKKPAKSRPQYSSRVVRSNFLSAAAMFLFIGSAVAFVGASFAYYVGSLAPLYQSYFGGSDGVAFTMLSVVDIVGLVGFGAGLLSGILCLKRKQLIVAVAGASFLLVAGTLHFAATALFPYGGAAVFALFFGIPITILAVLGLVLVVFCRKEFPQPQQ